MDELPWPEIPELAEVYDAECAGRWDHDFYLALAQELDPATVLDLGCGTGVFSVDIARQGRRSIGVDPALPMIEIARAREGGDTVEWIVGTAADAPTAAVDLVIMMGHVAQYFVELADWGETLRELRRVLRPGGWVAFETRNPAIDWAGRWTAANTRGTLDHPSGGTFESWVQVVEVEGSGTSYRMTHEGHTVLPDGRHLSARETLRFRARAEIEASLASHGFEVEEIWGDWDRSPVGDESPEFIFLARRT